MKGNCAICKTKESHAWKLTNGKELCGDCTHVSANYIPLHIKKQQNDKDLIQPYKYDKQSKCNIPNKDFERVYGKKKAKAFSETISTEQKRQQENKPLS